MSQSASPAAEPKRSSIFDHPLGFWFFFCGGCAERCCYYGMCTILVMYMTQILKFSDGTASRINYYFIAGCYILPLVGGYVADKILGNYRTIVYFAVPYVIGQAILGFSALHTTTYLFLSLVLLAIGSGMIKPNISTLMGMTYDQLRPGRMTLRSDAFAMFYGAINIGSMVSMLCVPLIRNSLGYTSHAYAAAFMLPAVLMTLSLLIFAFGKPFYAAETIQRRRRTPEEKRERVAVLRRMFGIFAVVVFFWAIYYQTTSTWIYFARDYLHLKLHLNLLVKVFDYDLSPDQLQLINPVLILVLLPPITMMWHVLARFGLNLKPTDKMLIGFVLTAITMVIVAWSAFYGAGRIVAGAPAAIERAEKGARAIDELTPRDPAAEKAAQELLDALRTTRAADAALAVAQITGDGTAISEARRAADAAEKNLDSLRERLKQANLEAIAVLCARSAATAALGTARGALDAAADGHPSGGDVKVHIETGSETARIAAKATADVLTLIAEAPQSRSAAGSKRDVSLAGMAANRTDGAAAAAESSLAAAEAGNARAAQINAAVAAVDAAGAAVAAAKVAADFTGAKLPPVVAEIEAANANAHISIFWQIIPYILTTMAEVCISVVGLELAFAAAPPALKTFMTACWLFTIFFANIINAQVSPLYNDTFHGISLTPDWYFLWFAVAMVPVTLAFVYVSHRFNRPATA